jgi:hypothetical protein
VRSRLRGLLRRRRHQPKASAPAPTQPQARADPDTHLRADSPIRSAEQDQLGREPLVRLIAEEIASSPVDAAFSIAVTGPWGEGKSSVLNLVERRLKDREDIVVVRFNPWLFSGAENLSARFFAELGSELEENTALADVAERLGDYGKALLPLTSLLGPYGAIFSGVVKAGGAVDELGSSKLLTEEGDSLGRNLKEAGLRIVVLVDDLDRLQPAERHEVVRLVKLIGNLPYITYLLAHEPGGGDDLAKVAQITHPLPAIQPDALATLLEESLSRALGELDPGDLDAIGPFFRNMRDVRLYANSVPATVRLAGGELAVGDLLGLEALRTFEPRVHQSLAGGAGEEKLAKLVKRAVRSPEATEKVLSRLFSADRTARAAYFDSVGV